MPFSRSWLCALYALAFGPQVKAFTLGIQNRGAEKNLVKCDACGQNYDAGHNCPAVITSGVEEEPASGGFTPIYYLRLALKIAFWDKLSIQRASRDSKVTIYGLGLWLIVALAVWFIAVLPDLLRKYTLQLHSLGAARSITVLGFGMMMAFVAMAVNTLIQVGAVHLIAKRFFDAKGTLIGVMRPSLLGSIVGLLGLIPSVGGDWAFAIAWTAVLVIVFEKIDRIGRKEALAICVGINVVSHLVLGVLGL